MLDSLTEFVSDSPITYALVWGLTMVDAFFPVVPGETVIIVAATLAVDGPLVIWLVGIVAAVGAILGDNVSYVLGRLVGKPVGRAVFTGDRGKKRLARGERLLKRHGRALVIAARFIPGGRTATTLSAGILHMEWRKFAGADVIGASVWAAYSAALGFFGGATFSESPWKGLLLALGVALLLAVAAEAYRRIQRARGRDVLGDEL